MNQSSMETTKTQLMSPSEIEEMVKTLPQHNVSWLNGLATWCKYQDVWHNQEFLTKEILERQRFEARTSDVFLCSYPKSGTTWLKALAYAIITRKMFDESNTPLLTTMPHKCVPSLERDFEQIRETNRPNVPIATHMPYKSLPESILASNCKIVYIYRNLKDVIVSCYHFATKIRKVPIEDASFEEAFDDFCQGVTLYGPYWDHISGYLKASLERPGMILLLKYEHLKKEPINNVKRLAEFLGYPFTPEEEKEGVIESVVNMCSFENLSNLEINKKVGQRVHGIENRLFFRKAEDGDWRNYFTDKMIEKIDKLIDEKLGDTGLVLK
ncbi:flavonol 4'-sulfotransferase-like [Bidens hawaiensis]|uniref:flavonol 4'-sulfotransferase-like n=1 Tax=Bidens hawaiensis TaxID=980011 RepID=UPI00404B6F1B